MATRTRQSNSIKTMLSTADALVGAPYTYGGGHGSWQSIEALRQFGVDCSGFVSYLLYVGGVPLSSPQTTEGLAAMLSPGEGPQNGFTVWDRATGPFMNQHTIINVAGNWYESGGSPGFNSSGGVSKMTPAQAQGELSGGGFAPFHYSGSLNMPSGRVRQFITTGIDSGGDSLSNLWIKAGGSPKVANTMAAIAMAESGGQVGIVSAPNTDGTVDRGLWQINSSHTQFDAQKLTTDPLYNAKAAVSVFRSQGLTAWTTYTSGAYRPFLTGHGTAPYTFTRPGGGTGGTGTGGGGSGNGSTDTSGGDVLAALRAQSDSIDKVPDVPQQAQLDSVSIFGVNVPTPGWGIIKSLFSGSDGGAYAPMLGAVPDPVGGIGNITSSIGGVGDFLKAIVWILNPINILRAVEFLLGIGLMVFGIQAATQHRGESAEGYMTSENALSRSGLGRVGRELGRAAVTRKAPVRPATAPHRTRRTALRVRYEREQKVSRRQTALRRGESGA